MRFMYISVLLTIILLNHSCNLIQGNKKQVLNSPDGSIQVQIDIKEDSVRYDLLFENRQVVKNGFWGVQMKDTLLFSGPPVQLNGPILVADSFTLRTGMQVKENFHEYELLFSGEQKIQVRIFDNAFAFRYLIDRESRWNVLHEISGWTIPDSVKTWFFERENAWKLKSYAGEWRSCRAGELHTVSPTGPVQGPPLVFDYGDEIYGMITEAALYNYSGMRLKASEMGKLSVDFTEGEGFVTEGEFVSPWRVFYIGKGLTSLVNQQVIHALNPDPDPDLFSDRSYIIPGKSAWRWWSKRIGTPAQERDIIDFAAELGFEYSLIDEGWERWENYWTETEKITSYAKEKNVRVILWKHSKELNLPENDFLEMRSWLDQIKAAGAAGAKVDFMNSESKATIDFDIRLLQEAAKRNMVIIFHGCQKPSGESRTYPNELTREGIRGLELNGHAEGPITASHNAALPFTRFVVGDGDYTPLGFTNPANTTWAHQLATLVCFTSYVQVIGEDPEFLLKNQKIEPVRDLIKRIPVIWDQTVVLEGSRIGELAAFARRAGDEWFVGVLNTKAKSFEIDFSFLGDGVFNTEVIEDISGPPATDQMFQKSQAEVSSGVKIKYNLQENGGLVLRITKK